MPRRLASLLIVLFVVATTADRLVCPDGCTDDRAGQSTSRDTAPPCAFCHGWHDTPRAVAPAPVARASARPAFRASWPVSPPPPVSEPPPKAA